MSEPILPAMTASADAVPQLLCGHERTETVTTSEASGGIGGGPVRDVETTVTRCADCGVEVQERQHVTDAAWDAHSRQFPGHRSPCGRGVWEQECTKEGTMLVTVEEWDTLQAYTLHAQQHALETGNIATGELLHSNELRAELATLRAQLAGRDERIDFLEAAIQTSLAQTEEANNCRRAMQAEIDRLRKELHDALASNPSRRAGGNPGDAAAVVGDRVGGQDVGRALLRVAGSEGKFGRGDAGGER